MPEGEGVPTDYAPGTKLKFELPPRTPAQLRLLLWAAFGVAVPDKQVCPNHSTPWRALCAAFFAASPLCVWVGSRGFAGKTFNLGTLGLAEGLALGANVTILGGSGIQSQRVHEVMNKHWQQPRAPRSMLLGEPGTIITRFTGGNSIVALTASSRSVRGPHPQRLRLDEVDEMDLSLLDAALGQTMSGIAYSEQVPAQTVISSTHQYERGTMTEVLKRAGERGWPVYEWCWRETHEENGGWLSQRDLDDKRAIVTQAMWDTEYELQKPTGEGRAIVEAKVKAMFRHDLGQYAGAESEYIEVEPPAEGATYATGADWAKEQHWTCIVTFRTDTRPCRLVAFERMRRLPWPTMVKRYDQRVTRFPGAAMHDATGIGNVVDDLLEVDAKPQLLVGRARADIFTEYIAAIEHEEYVAPWIDFMAAEHLYAQREDLYGSGHPPDSLVAGALAHRARGKAPVKLPGIGDYSLTKPSVLANAG